MTNQITEFIFTDYGRYQFEVQSETDPSKKYTVDCVTRVCNCPNYSCKKRSLEGGFKRNCKHLVFCLLIVAMRKMDEELLVERESLR